MAGADSTTASEVFKDYFLPGVNEELNNSCMILMQIDSNSEDVEGETIVASHHIGRSAGVGSRLENETLPAPGAQGYGKSDYVLYANYGTGRISTRLMKSIKTDRGAFVNAAKEELTRIKDDLKRSVNFQAWNTSDGVIAACDVTTAANVIVLSATTDRRVWNYLHLGFRVDIGTVAAPTGRAADRKITAIDKANHTITVDGAAVTTATTDRIFRSGSGGAIGGVGQREITGLQTIVNKNNTYANLNGATVPEWNSYVEALSGVWTEDAVQTVLMEIAQTGASTPDLSVTTPEILKYAGNVLKTDRQFVDLTVTLPGGFKGVSVQSPWGDITLTSDRDCPVGQEFFLNTGALTQWQYDDWAFLDEDGSVLHLVPGVAAYDFVLEKFHELGTLERKAHGRLTGITLS